jgi:hypothetical protein
MTCPECVKEAKRSVVYVGASSVTCMMYEHYFDEDGKEHVHNPNTTSTHYSCSQGHSWVEGTRGKCWCGL